MEHRQLNRFAALYVTVPSLSELEDSPNVISWIDTPFYLVITFLKLTKDCLYRLRFPSICIFCLLYQFSNFISLQFVFQIIESFHCCADFFGHPLSLIATYTHGAQRSVFVTKQPIIRREPMDRCCKEQFLGR